MDSLIRQLLVVSLLLSVAVLHTDARRPYIPGKPKPAPVSEPTQDTRPPDANMADIERRMADVELSTTIMKREMLEAKSENRRLQNEIEGMSALMQELDEAHNRVEELQRILGRFESFFGVLYTELPDVFAREMTVDRRLSALNEYIGNREAELMALRPSPPVVTAAPGEAPIDEELLGVVVSELSSENDRLKRRLDTMETRMTSPINFDGQQVITATGPDEDTQERLTRLERLLALTLAPQLDEEGDQATVQNNEGQRLAPGGSAPQQLALSDSDTDILREELNSIRSISSTRKSVFSAAATRHTYGEAGVHTLLHFDYVFSNKGNHFHEHNSTFVCYITGFYFITFTTRSYDNRYLGVSLLMNGERVTSVSGERDPEKNQMMTQSVVLHLTLGDSLWLTVAPADSYAVYSDHNKYCTFSGFLLFKGN